MKDEEKSAEQVLLEFEAMLAGGPSVERSFRSPKISLNNKDFYYYFIEEEVGKLRQSNGSIDIGLGESIYEYEKFVKELIQNATPETKLIKYFEWIELENFHVIIRDGDITKVSIPARIKTDKKRLTSFRKSSGIDKNLTVEYCWFFMLAACWRKSRKSPERVDIEYSHQEDNNGVQRFYEDKKFAHKTYQIINNRRYVFRISVDQEGKFLLLHDKEFIEVVTVLIFDRYKNGDSTDVDFDEAKESVHFVYVSYGGDNPGENVILSMQSFDLSINERLVSWHHRIEKIYNRIRCGIGDSRRR